MATPTVDYLLDDNLVMHDHSASDLGAVLDTRYVNIDGDLMTSALKGYITVDLRATILALTPTGNQLAYATDSNEFYLYDGTNWKVMPLELETETSTPDMGAFNADGLGVSDRTGYYKYAITDKNLSNIRILENARNEEGAVRTTTGGVFQVYLNSRWNNVVINFVLREDSAGTYELEHAPVGFVYYYEIMSGNSDRLGLDGKPIVTQYSSSMGCYQANLQIEGGSF